MCLCNTGPERDAHAVAEVARKELWGGVSCSQMQPNGHTFLGGKGARSMFLSTFVTRENIVLLLSHHTLTHRST